MFRGIPYATPPTGDRRWLPPEPETAWNDVRDATQFSIESAQPPFAMTVLFEGGQPENGEDACI